MKFFNDINRYKKFINCSIPYPFYDEKNHTFEWVMYNKNIKQFIIKTNLLDALEENVNYGFTYHYKAKLLEREYPEQELKYRFMINHCHQFEEVVRKLYDYPETFEIPDEFLEEYSKQELAYLKQIKNYLLLIGLKDWRESQEKKLLDKKWEEIDKKKNKSFQDILFLLSYSKKWKKLTEKEYLIRYENTKALEYASYNPIWFSDDKIANAIISGSKDYLICIQYSFSTPKLHDKFLLIDSNHNYLGVIEIISENIITFKDLKEDMVNYKLIGYKNFNEYKNYLLNSYIEESKCFNESFTENSLIKYAKIRVIKKF